jgi:hypothetical protein
MMAETNLLNRPQENAAAGIRKGDLDFSDSNREGGRRKGPLDAPESADEVEVARIRCQKYWQ